MHTQAPLQILYTSNFMSFLSILYIWMTNFYHVVWIERAQVEGIFIYEPSIIL